MTPQRIAAGEEWKREEQGEPWRPAMADTAVAEARQRIERLRKVPLRLRVVDQHDRPISEAPVEIVQTRASFPFGDQLWGLDRIHNQGLWDSDVGRYWRERFKDLYNAANALCYWTERPGVSGPKTEDLLGDPRLAGFARCVEWANGERLIVKGHPLFWTVPKALPDWLQRYDLETQYKFIEIRLRQIVSRFRGRVDIWDAVNEALWEPTPANVPHRRWPHLEPIDDIAEYVAFVLRVVREEDPDARYVVNDYGLLGSPRVAPDGTQVTSQAQRQRMVQLALALGERGQAPSALGMQCHTGGWVTPEQQLQAYDELARTGLPVHITEFGVPRSLAGNRELPEEELQHLQAEYTIAFLTLAYSHPAVEAFFFWYNFGMAVQWRKGGTRSDSHDFHPVYERLQQQLSQWRTCVDTMTSAEGEVALRGFPGSYALRLKTAGAQSLGGRFALNTGQDGVVTVKVWRRPEAT